MISNDLRLHRFVHTRTALLHQFTPLAHTLLRSFKKAAVCSALQEWKKFSDDLFGIAYQPHIDRIAQANPGRVQVYLHTLGLIRLGIKIQVRKAAAYDQQHVTLFHCILGGSSSKQANTASCEGTVIGDYRFPEQGLYYRRSNGLGELGDLLAATESSASNQNCRFTALVDDLCRCLKRLLRRVRVGGDINAPAVLLHVHV